MRLLTVDLGDYSSCSRWVSFNNQKSTIIDSSSCLCASEVRIYAGAAPDRDLALSAVTPSEGTV